MNIIHCAVLSCLITLISVSQSTAEVLAADKQGFQIAVTRSSDAASDTLYRAFIAIEKWWDGAHSFSGNANNLSMDFEKACFLEKLPNGGFVRHLEIAHHRPGQRICLTGGLGPLQEMGVHGAMTISFTDQDGKGELKVTYNVSGFRPDGLDEFAPIVDRVLAGQIDRLIKFAEELGKQNDGD